MNESTPVFGEAVGNLPDALREGMDDADEHGAHQHGEAGTGECGGECAKAPRFIDHGISGWSDAVSSRARTKRHRTVAARSTTTTQTMNAATPSAGSAVADQAATLRSVADSPVNSCRPEPPSHGSTAENLLVSYSPKKLGFF
ncbi:hypothetical protein R1T08_00555 [Streptomyces sp. SBC-4]|nr:hypothetical protein [Streptomyces sp. SBC-4]MDV5142855.1 hypothetical protein [Streptomyces sp. SBC-4]